MRIKNWIMVVLILAAVILATPKVCRLLAPPASRQALSACPAQEANTQGDIVFVGCVVDNRGELVQDAWAMLTLTDTSGQTLWQGSFRPDPSSGLFKLSTKGLPGLSGVHGGVVAAEAPQHLASKVNVLVSTDAQGNTKMLPTSAVLRLESYSPLLTFIILIPGIIGLMMAVSHLTEWSKAIGITYTYAFGSALVWSLAVLALVICYAKYGDSLIPLFFPDLFVSSGVVVFAFIGSLVYAAYTLEADPDFFAKARPEAMRSLLMMLGGRITVAPYIALVAYGVFAATFPTLHNGAFAIFFAFFTGLWINAVIEALNGIGNHFLSEESKKKVEDLMARAVAPEVQAPATTSAAAMKPEKAFLDAVELARGEFLQKEGVIGVARGFKVSSGAGNTGQQAIVAYVYEKKELASGDENLIPTTFNGVLTDVVPVADADPEQPCRPGVFNLSWKKIHSDHEKAIRSLSTVPRDTSVSQVGQVLVLTDPDEQSFFSFSMSRMNLFDPIAAYQAVRPRLGDSFDFVAFVVDTASGLPNEGDYYIPVFNEVSGINFYQGAQFSDRDLYASRMLRGLQVHSKPLTLRGLLHELGHAWCAYPTYAQTADGATSFRLLMGQSGEGILHWGPQFDDGHSCMDYDLKEWIPKNGGFISADIKDIDFGYCPLDLYMMGFIPPEAVGPLRILSNAEFDSAKGLWTAAVEEVSIDKVIASCGVRNPAAAASPHQFRQAFVVLTKDTNSGEGLAQTIETKFRSLHEANFSKATLGKGSLTTRLT